MTLLVCPKSRIIPPGHTDLSEVCIEIYRLASSISTKGVHNLKAAEFIVSKPLDENSSRVNCECFKVVGLFPQGIFQMCGINVL